MPEVKSKIPLAITPIDVMFQLPLYKRGSEVTPNIEIRKGDCPKAQHLQTCTTCLTIKINNIPVKWFLTIECIIHHASGTQFLPQQNFSESRMLS